MRKPKSKAKQIADNKRGLKRSKRFKASRIKVARRRQAAIEKRAKEKREYEEFMNKMLEARMRGGF